MTVVIPTGSRAAYSVMLMYNNDAGAFSLMKLTEKLLRVDKKISTVLRNTVKDMVVCAGRSLMNRCSNFDFFLPEFVKGTSYVLRHVNTRG